MSKRRAPFPFLYVGRRWGYLTVVQTDHLYEQAAWTVLDDRGRAWWYASTFEEVAELAALYLALLDQ